MYQRKVDVDKLNTVKVECERTFRALALRRSKKGVMTKGVTLYVLMVAV